MKFHIGIENNPGDRSQAWDLKDPGCFAYGVDGNAALMAMPDAIRQYSAWIAENNHGESWLDLSDIEIHLAETWEVYQIDKKLDLADHGYEVNAWFMYDWKPLTQRDIERGTLMLAWSRRDLLNTTTGLSGAELSASHSGERWSISGILNHIGKAEWWYMDRIGLAKPGREMIEDPFKHLEVVRARLLEVLPSLTGSTQVLGIDGEFWSPRKMLRRAVWHERDHTSHIHKLIRN